MPQLRAFRGLRYAASGELKDLVCPPYDVITPDDQIRLHERHPHNAVRVELPFSDAPGATAGHRYEIAGRRFREWCDQGVLVRSDRAALYVYRQDFIFHGERCRVQGVIGALGLEPFGAGILPHEHTMPGPVEDRLALLRACPVNISPIYGIVRGGGALLPYFDSLATRPPEARFVDDTGTLHRLWAVSMPAEIDMLSGAFAEGPLVIADGHHRYETALAYRAEMDGAPGERDAVMCFCVDADSEDVRVLPYHRSFVTRAGPAELGGRLRAAFHTRTVAPGAGAAALAASRAAHAFLFLLPGEELLVEASLDDVDARVGARPEAWRRLDVVALHEVVMPLIAPDGVERLSFSSDPDGIAQLVRSSEHTAAVVLRPLRASDVIEVARAGERMPQKASFFWPKALTGLVFRPLT